MHGKTIDIINDTAFPLADANGNAVSFIDEAGNVQAHYTYDAFGGTVSQDGPMAVNFRFRFSSKYLDDETGLYYYGYRYDSPALGRWLSRDPIGEQGGKNLYGFIFNSPMDFLDATGLCVIIENPIGVWPILGVDDSNFAGVFIARVISKIIWGEGDCPGAKKGPCFGEIFIRKVHGVSTTAETTHYIGVIEHERVHAGCLKNLDSSVASLSSMAQFECPCGEMSSCDGALQDYINAAYQLSVAQYGLCDSSWDCSQNDRNNPSGKYCKKKSEYEAKIEKIRSRLNLLRITKEVLCKEE